MIVTIDKREQDITEQMCALSNCKVRFYTNETNPLMVQAEITELNGDDISVKDAWYIGRSIVWNLATSDMKNL